MKVFRKIKIVLVTATLLFVFSGMAAPVLATDGKAHEKDRPTIEGYTSQLITLDTTATTVAESGVIFKGVTKSCYKAGICTLCDILVVFVNVANVILRLFAILGVIFVVYGAAFMMLSQGSSERLNKGKGVLKAAVIGSFIVLGAWQVMSIVVLLVANGQIFNQPDTKDNAEYNPITGWFTLANRCQDMLGTGTQAEVSGDNESDFDF